MNRLDDHSLNIGDEKELTDAAESLFDLAWRFDFETSGFAVVDAPANLDSRGLRGWMLALAASFSAIGRHRGLGPLGIRSLGRFDQQETTKFHLDGAPERSLLILGYEPSTVHSRVLLADYARAAFDLRMSPRQFLQDWNPMYRRGEAALAPYVTELPRQPADRSRILLTNNSSLAYDDAKSNPLGVLHQAIIVAPDASQRRIVNSMMLAGGESDTVGADQRLEFMTDDKISQKVYPTR